MRTDQEVEALLKDAFEDATRGIQASNPLTSRVVRRAHARRAAGVFTRAGGTVLAAVALVAVSVQLLSSPGEAGHRADAGRISGAGSAGPAGHSSPGNQAKITIRLAGYEITVPHARTPRVRSRQDCVSPATAFGRRNLPEVPVYTTSGHTCAQAVLAVTPSVPAAARAVTSAGDRTVYLLRVRGKPLTGYTRMTVAAHGPGQQWLAAAMLAATPATALEALLRSAAAVKTPCAGGCG